MPLDVFSLVMAFLTSATSLAAALVQYQTAKIAAQGTKKRANRRRNPRRRGRQKRQKRQKRQNRRQRHRGREGA